MSEKKKRNSKSKEHIMWEFRLLQATRHIHFLVHERVHVTTRVELEVIDEFMRTEQSNLKEAKDNLLRVRK